VSSSFEILFLHFKKLRKNICSSFFLFSFLNILLEEKSRIIIFQKPQKPISGKISLFIQSQHKDGLSTTFLQFILLQLKKIIFPIFTVFFSTQFQILSILKMTIMDILPHPK
jgi:hypothetical protein